MGITRIVPPDQSMMFATVGGTAVDDTYLASWLVDGIPGRPWRVFGSTAAPTITAGASLSIDTVAIINHNLPASATITVSGGVTGTIPTATWGRDGMPKGWYLRLTTPVTASSFTLNVSGGGTWVTLGEVYAGLSHDASFLTELEHDPGTPRVEWQDGASLAPYDDGVSKRRTWRGNRILSLANYQLLAGWDESTRNGTRPLLLIPNDGINDAACVTIKFTATLKELLYFCSVEFTEILGIGGPRSMALHLLFSDDFSGYSSQSQFELAYPYDPPTDMSSSLTPNPSNPADPYVAWGLTRGPGDVPGLQNVTSDTGDPYQHGQFWPAIDKVGLAPQCRYFQIEGRFDFSGVHPVTEPLNGHSELLVIWSYELGNRLDSFDGNLVFIGRLHNSGTLVITVQTTAAYGNSTTPAGLYGVQIAGAIPNLSTATIRAYGRSSILTQTGGEWVPSTDGFVQVFVNESQVFSFEGPVWHGDESANANRNWNSATFNPVGRFTDLKIWDSDECGTLPPIGTPSCECPPTNNPPGTTTPPVITIPPNVEGSVPEQLDCGGGGFVPIQDDFAPVENWWGL